MCIRDRIESKDIIPAVERAFEFLQNEQGIAIEYEQGVCERIANGCGGDVRKAMNSVENCVLATPVIDGEKTITLDIAGELTQ